MEDRFTKFSKLYFLVAGIFLAVPVTIAILVGIFYGFFSIFASKPVDVVYQLIIVCIPPALFAAVYYIFIKRTKSHPSKAVKIISQVLFVLAFCTCFAVLLVDIIDYFKSKYKNYEIANFKSFSIAFLAGNVALLFIIAIVQAFTSAKEEDWMEKRKRKNLE